MNKVVSIFLLFISITVCSYASEGYLYLDNDRPFIHIDIPCYHYSLDYPLVVGNASMPEIIQAIQKKLTRYAQTTTDFDRQTCGGKGYGLNPDEWFIALNGKQLSLYAIADILSMLPTPEAAPLVEVQYTGRIY